MAKGKHSPALFEVVHGKKRFDKSAAVLRTPNWWFKGRHRGPVAPVLDAGEAPAFADEADPTQRGLPSPTADREPEPDPAPAEYESAVDEDPTAFAMPQPRRRNSAFQFVVDRDRQELFFRVRFTAAIVGGFALIVVIALAYMGGRHLGRGPSTALATQSSEEVAVGPVEKRVLDVGTRSGAVGANTAPNPGLGTGGVSSQPAPQRPYEATIVPTTLTPNARQPGPSTPTKPPDFENGRRIVGKQYIVIQAYPRESKKEADEARDFLLKNNVSCTVEKTLPGWNGWNTIVSTQGFDRASGPEFEAFMTRLVKLGEVFAGKSAWKRFEPTAVRWKEANN
jgi:hypothetical protein